jgi:hypothetical protein
MPVKNLHQCHRKETYYSDIYLYALEEVLRIRIRIRYFEVWIKQK